jgi:hypothetical protein
MDATLQKINALELRILVLQTQLLNPDLSQPAREEMNFTLRMNRLYLAVLRPSKRQGLRKGGGRR